jgi:hypothetical protein
LARIVSGKLTITCLSFPSLRRSTLLGLAEIEIAELQFRVRDVAIHHRNGARWAQLPAKPQIKDGTLVKDATGKVQYTPVLEFTSRAVRDAFSAAVIRAVLDRTPYAFEEEAAA